MIKAGKRRLYCRRQLHRSTVRVENEYSRKMMKSCGFTEDNATTTNLVAFVDEDDEVDYGFVKVVNYHITKEQYLQGHLS